MRNISTTGIILKKNNGGEADQFITFYSPDLGKVDAFARGARKIDSQFTGHLEVLNICKFQLYKNQDRFSISQCQSIKIFRNIHENLDKAMIGLLLIEIFQKFTDFQESDTELFNLITATIENLDQNNNHKMNLESFKVKLLNLLGLMPDVTRCSFCSKKWQNESIILLDNDLHLTCQNCRNDHSKDPKMPQITPKAYKEISFGIIKLLNFLKSAELTVSQRITLRGNEAKLLETLTNTFLQQHLNHELKTEAVLARLYK